MQLMYKHILFMIIGHSGVGKTTLLKRLCNQNPKFSIVTKISTRSKRITDDFQQEIILTTDNNFNYLDRMGLIEAKYIKYGFKYGYLARSCSVELEDRIIEGVGLDVLEYTNTFAVGDLHESQKALINWQPKIVILLYAPIDVIKKRLQDKKLPELQLEARLDSLNTLDPTGMPQVIPSYDYRVSTDMSVEDTTADLQKILDYELRGR